MLNLSPSLDDRDACTCLDRLFAPSRSSVVCRDGIRRLHRRFKIYAETSPEPIPAPGLNVTPEIRRQSEMYLPISDIFAAFCGLFQAVLTFPPILASTPFHNAQSWADVFVALPPQFQFSANPACLLERLCQDPELLTVFLFSSFLPNRFYGGFNRYPLQQEFLLQWIAQRQSNRTFRGLDAACGTGEDSYGLARLLVENGYPLEDFQIEGWTLEPLEVWSAAHARFPHDPSRQVAYRREIKELFERGAAKRICFRIIDLRDAALFFTEHAGDARFDLILCNGLLGGPILNNSQQVRTVVTALSKLLSPDGILLIADSFHGGWKQKYPADWLKEQLDIVGLATCLAGEGVCATWGTLST